MRPQGITSPLFGPRLPASYFTMFVVALVPPFWRRLMHHRLDALEASKESGRDFPAELLGQRCG